MNIHTVQAEKKSGDLAREDQLAWKIAELAVRAREVSLDPESVEMVRCRLIDNAAIAIGAIDQPAVVAARGKALPYEGTGGATVHGLPGGRTFPPLEAAFANAVAVRFLDQDDTYLAAEYSHPDDNISPILAVAQHMGAGAEDMIRGIIVAYEVHVALVGTGDGTGICLHEHKVDHMTHIAAATAAGLSSMLGLSIEETYHAVNFAVHNAVSSRQSRKGDIGAQKEFVPGFSARISIDAVDSAMQGLKGPNPVYEGVDSIIRRFLNGRENPAATYKVALADPGKDALRNILITYPKEHAFEYQGQAIIDMALEIREQLPKRPDGSVDTDKIAEIVLETSQHTHHVIGTDANDPQKIDPDAPRGTLDHSIMFAIARAIQKGEWHHERTYAIAPGEKNDLRVLMEKVRTVFDQRWEDAYHSQDPKVQAFGGKIIIALTDGKRIGQEKARANAHVYGATPWGREHYIKKFDSLTEGRVSAKERERFLKAVDALGAGNSPVSGGLTVVSDLKEPALPSRKGIYAARPEEPGRTRAAV